MALHLSLIYASGADLQAYLLDQMNHGAVLLPVDGDLSAVVQFDPATLDITVGPMRGCIEAQVLQVLPGTGIVLQLSDPKELSLLAEGACAEDEAESSEAHGGGAPSGRRRPPTVEIAALTAIQALDAIPDEEGAMPWDAEAETLSGEPAVVGPLGEEPAASEISLADGPDDDADSSPEATGDAPAGHAPFAPAGSSPVSWSIELLQARWDQLTLAERIRVARYGNRPARNLVLRGADRTLHIHLLQNPGLSLEEVTLMAGMANLDPVTLQRIASSVDWQKQASVARALLTNPKLPQTLVPRLLRSVPRDDLSRLARTGKVRAAVKEAIVKHLDRTR